MKKKSNWLEAALLAAPFFVLVLVWKQLPEKIPMHWNLAGQADRWSSSKAGILLAPLLSLGVLVLCHVLPRLDPKLRASSAPPGRMPAVLQIIRSTLAGFFCILFGLQLAAAFHWPISAPRLVLASLLLLFAIIGNYLGNLQPNYFFGIRTPWTLENPATWRATHRHGGRLMFFISNTLLLLQFFISEPLMVLLTSGLLLLLAIWCVFYSWHDFRARSRVITAS